jgi:hypothetical protein
MTANDNPGCLAGLFGRRPPRREEVSVEYAPPEKEEITFPYRINKRFLSNAEHSFYLVAKQALGDDYVLCPQVSMAGIFWIPYEKGYQTALNRIHRKRIDFVVCDARTMKLQFAIELDDSSHEQDDRIERDEFVDQVFRSAGLPLIRIRARDAYNILDLKTLFYKVLPPKGAEKPPVPINRDEAPFLPEIGVRDVPRPPEPVVKPVESQPVNAYDFCPNCGSPMKVRKSIAGPNVDHEFYVCSRYPECKTYLRVE